MTVVIMMNLFFQQAGFMFGSVAMDMIQPLLLNAVEDRLGQQPRDALEYLLKGYRRQVSKGDLEALQLSFERVFQLLSQAQEELGGQSWFDMFVTEPHDDEGSEGCNNAELSSKLKESEAPMEKEKLEETTRGWFDFCFTMPGDVTKATDGASMDVVPPGDEPEPDGLTTGYDRRLYFLMDVFSGLSL